MLPSSNLAVSLPLPAHTTLPTHTQRQWKALLRLPDMTAMYAKALSAAGINTVEQLAAVTVTQVYYTLKVSAHAHIHSPTPCHAHELDGTLSSSSPSSSPQQAQRFSSTAHEGLEHQRRLLFTVAERLLQQAKQCTSSATRLR